jgi:hypothetical protein
MHHSDGSKSSVYPDCPEFTMIGWLDPVHPFNKGEPDKNLLTALMSLLKDPFQVRYSMGWEVCQLCNTAEDKPLWVEFAGRKVKAGVANLLVPGEGHIYYAPSLLIHYMLEHKYLPPADFQSAVLRSPRMNSLDYLNRLISLGVKIDLDVQERIFGKFPTNN